MVGSRTVFVVEDDPHVRTVLTEVLQREGFSAREFATGEELLASDLGRAGCIVVDMRLPAMQGEDVIREVKMRNPAVPIVVVTAFGNVHGAVSAMKAGAADYLQKPVDAPQFVAAVRTAVEANAGRENQGAQARVIKEKLAALSEDELRVYRLLVAGHPNKQIASMLGNGLRTVELRRATLLKKMNAGSLPELVRMAILGELTEEPPA